MPDLTWNKAYWDGDYDWRGRGEEWSQAWGSSEAQWFGSLYPRLHRFLPAERVLEIAPGHGRWTHYLLQYTRADYLGIDLAAEGIDYCRAIFAARPLARFAVNDGLSLEQAEDGAFDLVFSFDSLVHAEMEVHERYVPQILAKLTPTGVAFIHHSNWAEVAGAEVNRHVRGENVGARAFAALVRQHGGAVLVQERIAWGMSALCDALTLFCRAERAGAETTIERDNPRFMLEAALIRDIHYAYCQVPAR